MRKCSDHTLTSKIGRKAVIHTHTHMQTGWEGIHKGVKMRVDIMEVKSVDPMNLLKVSLMQNLSKNRGTFCALY